jgi:hypothetical protein
MSKPLSEIARQAWLECPLDGDHWESAATAVRKAVLEEAIEAANKIGNEFSEKSERAEIEDDAHYYDAVSVGAKRVFAALQRLMGDE